MNKRDIDAFVHDIQLMIPVSDDNSKRFLKDMCSSISDYVSAHEKCTLDEIIGEFGDPKDIALDYIDSLDSNELVRKLSHAQLLRRLVAIVAATAVVALTIYTAFLYRGYTEFENSLLCHENTVVEETGD